MTGQHFSSVRVPATVLAHPGADLAPDTLAADGAKIRASTPAGLGDNWDFVSALRALIRPYLARGHLHLSLVAEIVGMSERSLQRRLAQSGLTYSQLVQEARFSIASELLVDPDFNMMDIALAAGYDNAPHFPRAFKRLTDMTPHDYRRGLG